MGGSAATPYLYFYNQWFTSPAVQSLDEWANDISGLMNEMGLSQVTVNQSTASGVSGDVFVVATVSSRASDFIVTVMAAGAGEDASAGNRANQLASQLVENIKIHIGGAANL